MVKSGNCQHVINVVIAILDDVLNNHVFQGRQFDRYTHFRVCLGIGLLKPVPVDRLLDPWPV